MTLRDRLPTHTCTRCGLPVHETGSRCTDCRYPYAKETSMPAQRSRTLTRPGNTDEHEKGEHWDQQAECVGMPLRLWYPENGAGSDSPKVRAAAYAEAKAICDTCPVKNQCLQDALDRGEQEGMWGGLDPTERRLLKRRALRKPKPAGNRLVPTRAEATAARDRVHDLLAQGRTRAYITRITGLHQTTVGRIARAYEDTLTAQRRAVLLATPTTPKDAA